MLASLITKISKRSNAQFTGVSVSSTLELGQVTKWGQYRHRTFSAVGQKSSSPSSQHDEEAREASLSTNWKSGTEEKLPRRRSFLLDPPSKPPRKRASPLRTLPPTASAFERRIASNPYAFMTKLIQAAPESRGGRTWIVPEKIIPERLISRVTAKQDSNRFGVGKWMYSGSETVESMAKEGKYKMINSSAYMRPDIARLIYAQWTVRIAYDASQICKRGSKQLPIVTLKKSESGLESGNSVVDDIAVYDIPENKRIHCVLCFQVPDNTDPEVQPTRREKLLTLNDITQPKLPSFVDRSRVLSHVKTRYKNKTSFRVPMYDMEQLFENHPQGLEYIRQSLLKNFSVEKNQATTTNFQLFGLVESQMTLPLAVGLWKLASILPKSEKI
ncbi:hypothetical protein BGX27_000970 [Mortierella sp. AM989]|nr:hypothetical protein BGX27_000970 [Mortierella sp. AM989]